MRQWSDIVDFVPILVGTIEGAGETAVGNPIDTMGFQDVMFMLTYGCCGGTGGQSARLKVTIQEGASAAGTGGDMSTINDGMITGTHIIITAYGTAPTYPYLASTYWYERLNDSKRNRYLRAIVTSTNAAGCEFAYTLGAILGRPRDTLYICRATVVGSTNAEYKKPAA